MWGQSEATPYSSSDPTWYIKKLKTKRDGIPVSTLHPTPTIFNIKYMAYPILCVCYYSELRNTLTI